MSTPSPESIRFEILKVLVKHSDQDLYLNDEEIAIYSRGAVTREQVVEALPKLKQDGVVESIAMFQREHWHITEAGSREAAW